MKKIGPSRSLPLFIPLAFFVLFMDCVLPVRSQTGDPYLVSADFYVSVDNWADIWLNGISIVDSLPHTPPNVYTKRLKNKLSTLCYFTRDNVLAIEISKSVLPPKNQDQKSVGFAYILILKLSDGREITLTSAEAADHKAFYVPNQNDSDPRDWNRKGFDDSSWGSAYLTGVTIPDCTDVPDPRTGTKAPFLSARGISYESLQPGERHLFRRAFSLPIRPNPRCLTPTPEKESERPAAVLPETPRHPELSHPSRPTETFTPTATDTPVNVIREIPPILPTPTPLIPFTPTPIPRLTDTPWVNDTGPFQSPVVVPPIKPLRPKSKPLWHSTPNPGESAPSPEEIPPTWTPIPRPIHRKRKIQAIYPTWTVKFWTPSPTPTSTPTPTPTIFWNYHPPTPTPQALDILPILPTPTVPPPGSNALPQTLVADSLPANLYVNFADGPGVYRVDILDLQGKVIRRVYENRVTTQKEDWAYWDGKDGSGRMEPPGTYRVVFTLDETRLKDVFLRIGAESP